MNTLETCTELERRGELPPGEGVKPMNLVSHIVPSGSSTIAFADASMVFCALQIVLTDGAPTDSPDSVLVRIARRVSCDGDNPVVRHFTDLGSAFSNSWTKEITLLAKLGSSSCKLGTKKEVSRNLGCNDLRDNFALLIKNF